LFPVNREHLRSAQRRARVYANAFPTKLPCAMIWPPVNYLELPAISTLRYLAAISATSPAGKQHAAQYPNGQVGASVSGVGAGVNPSRPW
jgi:hypothetical protein